MQDTRTSTRWLVALAAVASVWAIAVESSVRAQECYPPPDGVVAWWTGDGDATDFRGNYHGTAYGNLAYVDGMVGQAFRFDGIDDYVLVGDADALEGLDRTTIEFWTLTGNLSQTGPWNYRIMLSKSAWCNGPYVVAVCGGHTIGMGFSAGDELSPSNSRNTADGSLQQDRWTHVALVFDNTLANPFDLVKMYIDGALQSGTGTVGGCMSSADRGVLPGESLVVNDAGLTIGARMEDPRGWSYYCADPTPIPRSFYDGLMDELTLYDRALTPDQILGIVNAGPAGKCRTGACCTDGPGIESECIDTTWVDCMTDHKLFFGEGTECTADIECIPLLVEFESVTAIATSDGVRLDWTTALEIDTIGFRVLRQMPGRTAKSIAIASPLIPAYGAGLGGGSYGYFDNAPEALRAEFYFLEELDINGRWTRFGPFRVQRNRERHLRTADQ